MFGINTFPRKTQQIDWNYYCASGALLRACSLPHYCCETETSFLFYRKNNNSPPSRFQFVSLDIGAFSPSLFRKSLQGYAWLQKIAGFTGVRTPQTVINIVENVFIHLVDYSDVDAKSVQVVPNPLYHNKNIVLAI